MTDDAAVLFYMRRRMQMASKKVVVGMSGGVDSSVAAWLLKQQGYDVIGVTMQIWQEEEDEIVEENGGCCGLSAVDDARRVAERIGIPYYVMNFREVFREKVIDNFVSEYEKGRTPNPCIVCNHYVKWKHCLRRHWLWVLIILQRATMPESFIFQMADMRLKKAAFDRKDQTYSYNLNQHQLAHTLMPVGAYDKSEVRRIAGKSVCLWPIRWTAMISVFALSDSKLSGVH